MRIKTSSTRKRNHNKLLGLAKGYRMSAHRLHKKAADAVLHAGAYAFAGRKNRKRDFRQLWITRINGSLSGLGISYSKFIFGLKREKIEIDRKMLADLVIKDIETFKTIVNKVK